MSPAGTVGLRHQGGFTMIELLTALIVVGILAAIAMPVYSAYVERSKRAAARAALSDAAGFLERSFTTNGCYDRTTVANCQSRSGTVVVLPPALQRAPSEGRASYALAVDFSASMAGQAYTLTATPCGTAGTCPAGSELFVDAECGALTLTQAGTRGVTASGSVATCWQR